jgi:DNA-binding transcriptional LysR family regulator
MDIRQLQTLIALINNDFNVSVTAEKLFLVQSAVSQQLKRLEQELGSDLFIRKGKRMTGLTPFGEQVVQQAYEAIGVFKNIQRLAEDQLQMGQGILRIGCTHTQARYILPAVINQFNRSYPDVELQMHQGNPQQLVEWAVHDVVDFSICTEELAQSDKLESIPCYRWNRCLITLPDHPIQKLEKPTLPDLCQYPIVTYVMGFTGRKSFNQTFEKERLKPNTVLSAADTDIIKTYVLDGLGIGVIASMAYNENIDRQLCFKDLSHLFPWETTRIAYLKNKYIRRYQQTFIDLFLETIRKDQSSRIEAL